MLDINNITGLTDQEAISQTIKFGLNKINKKNKTALEPIASQEQVKFLLSFIKKKDPRS